MPVQVTYRFDEYPIKNEGFIMFETFSPYNYTGIRFRRSGRIPPERIIRSGRKWNSPEILCLSCYLQLSLRKIR